MNVHPRVNSVSKLQSIRKDRYSRYTTSREQERQAKLHDQEQMANALVAITNISTNSTALMQQMTRANDLEEQKVRLEEQKMKAEEMKLKIELAKALGNVALLEDLMKSISSD
jgi:hypothetical protein